MGFGPDPVQAEAHGGQPLLHLGLQEEGQDILREPVTVGHQGEIEASGRNQAQQFPQVRVEGHLAAGEADHFEPQGPGLGEDRGRGLQGQKTGGVRLVAETVPAGPVAPIRGLYDNGFHPVGYLTTVKYMLPTLQSNSYPSGCCPFPRGLGTLDSSPLTLRAVR